MLRAERPVAVQETRKKEGVCYAWSDEGLELPVIDVTHPAFRLDLDDAALKSLVDEAVREMERRDKMPRFVQRLLLAFYLRESILAARISGSRGGYLDGIGTYLLKLGPENLGAGYAKGIDRKIASSLPCLSARLRLQNMAHLIANGVSGGLEASPGRALQLVNIAGGPAADSLNALTVLRRNRPELLAGRPIFVHVLDLDDHGPAFGARALAALRAEGAPLHDVEIVMRHTRYAWSDPAALKEFLVAIDEGIVAGSSEGGLFEYGSDREIVDNLRSFAQAVPSDTLFAGTISRTDGIARRLNGASGAALYLRDLDAFASLAEQAGWKVGQVVDSPLNRSIALRKT